MEVHVGSLGFKILPEIFSVADSLFADGKEMGKDEGSRRCDGKTNRSERLRMRDPLVTCATRADAEFGVGR